MLTFVQYDFITKNNNIEFTPTRQPREDVSACLAPRFDIKCAHANLTVGDVFS